MTNGEAVDRCRRLCNDPDIAGTVEEEAIRTVLGRDADLESHVRTLVELQDDDEAIISGLRSRVGELERELQVMRLRAESAEAIARMFGSPIGLPPRPPIVTGILTGEASS